MPAASLRALLAQAIDYAGLFPPASLELEPALAAWVALVPLLAPALPALLQGPA